jgi:hypothetical protein
MYNNIVKICLIPVNNILKNLKEKKVMQGVLHLFSFTEVTINEDS